MTHRSELPFKLFIRFADEPLSEVYDGLSLEVPFTRRVKVARQQADAVARGAFDAAAQHAQRRGVERGGLDLPVASGHLADGRPWLAFERRDGMTLEQHVGLHGLPSPSALTGLLAGVARALGGLHRAGIALGELSASRVFLEGGSLGFPVLTGLEGAIYPGVPERALEDGAIPLVRTPRGDLKGLGLLALALMDTPAPDGHGVPLLPEGYERLSPVIDRCLEHDPSARFSGVEEVLAALSEERMVDPFKGVFGEELLTPPEGFDVDSAELLFEPETKPWREEALAEAWFARGQASGVPE